MNSIDIIDEMEEFYHKLILKILKAKNYEYFKVLCVRLNYDLENIIVFFDVFDPIKNKIYKLDQAVHKLTIKVDKFSKTGNEFSKGTVDTEVVNKIDVEEGGKLDDKLANTGGAFEFVTEGRYAKVVKFDIKKCWCILAYLLYNIHDQLFRKTKRLVDDLEKQHIVYFPESDQDQSNILSKTFNAKNDEFLKTFCDIIKAKICSVNGKLENFYDYLLYGRPAELKEQLDELTYKFEAFDEYFKVQNDFKKMQVELNQLKFESDIISVEVDKINQLEGDDSTRAVSYFLEKIEDEFSLFSDLVLNDLNEQSKVHNLHDENILNISKKKKPKKEKKTPLTVFVDSVMKMKKALANMQFPVNENEKNYWIRHITALIKVRVQFKVEDYDIFFRSAEFCFIKNQIMQEGSYAGYTAEIFMDFLSAFEEVVQNKKLFGAVRKFLAKEALKKSSKETSTKSKVTDKSHDASDQNDQKSNTSSKTKNKK